MATLLLATRKGVFVVERSPVSGWTVIGHHFQGDAVTRVFADPRDGAWYAALRHGHYGVKLQKAWTAVQAGPKFRRLPSQKPEHGPWANDETPWTVELVWALAPGAANEPGVLWAGCMPAAVFRSGDGGASWQLCESFWLDERRRAWMGGGNDYRHALGVC